MFPACSHMLHERTANADCFLRNMHGFKYISNIDIDEVILPRQDKDLVTMLGKLEPKLSRGGVHYYQFQHDFYFLDLFKRKLRPDEIVPEYVQKLKEINTCTVVP